MQEAELCVLRGLLPTAEPAPHIMVPCISQQTCLSSCCQYVVSEGLVSHVAAWKALDWHCKHWVLLAEHYQCGTMSSTDSVGLALTALNVSCRALSAWYNEQQSWGKLVKRVMDQDWSWANPALDYIELYYKALRG